ncbi:MAG: NnrS family protein [Pseudomonadales bacterium]
MNIEEPVAQGNALLQKGFRPFFLLATAGGMLMILIWVASYAGLAASPADYYGHNVWHLHEMLFGYSTAVIAGFLLTAVANWTGRETATGTSLAILAAVWLAGRIAPLLPLPELLIALLDLTFLPLLAGLLASRIIVTGNKRNYFVPVLLSLLWFANLGIHLQALGISDSFALPGQRLALAMIWLLICVIATRILPAFSKSGLTDYRGQRNAHTDKLAILACAAFAIAYTSNLTWLLGTTGLLACALICVQLIQWRDRKVWQVPLLWVLHLGYGWLALGLLMIGLQALGFINSPFNLGLHAATIGAVGGLTLGMMARVSLGHTGRKLNPNKAVITAFILVQLAVLMRAVLPLFVPQHYISLVQFSGLLWGIALGIFVVVFTPILISARPDGRPG